MAAAIAAAVAGANAARPPRAERPPKELAWPTNKDIFSGNDKEDFAEWLVGYRQLTAHVSQPYRVQHLLTCGVSATIRKNVEGYAVTQGVRANELPWADVCDYIATTYDRPNGGMRRIIRYLGLQQRGLTLRK